MTNPVGPPCTNRCIARSKPIQPKASITTTGLHSLSAIQAKKQSVSVYDVQVHASSSSGCLVRLSWNRKRVQLGTIPENRQTDRPVQCIGRVGWFGPRNKTCAAESRFGCAIHQKHNFRSVRFSMQARCAILSQKACERQYIRSTGVG